MGSRRSKHNKGRKVDKHHDIASVVCEKCSDVFFQRADRLKKGRGRICPSCLPATPVPSSHTSEDA